MKIDLHIHTRDCSDGTMTLAEVFAEAYHRNISVISITDHDSIDCQHEAGTLASRYGIHYITGVELSISFAHPDYRNAKPVPLDVLGYQIDIRNRVLVKKLQELREYRRNRAEQILGKINRELERNHLVPFTHKDMEAIEDTVDGAFGRPHIANYMVKKNIVSSKQEAFDKYLVKCNVPKMPLSLGEASKLIRGAGGKVILAHPNDPHGTSLVALTPTLKAQHRIIKDAMLPELDGIECWHSRHDGDTVASYLSFSRQEALMVTGGSDCHQQPVLLGTVDVPDYVTKQFGILTNGQ